MTDKMTRDDKLLLSYRRETLNKKLENIKNTLNGRNFSFLPFITDENGNANAEKLEAFISELLAPLPGTNKEFFRQKALNLLRGYGAGGKIAPVDCPGAR